MKDMVTGIDAVAHLPYATIDADAAPAAGVDRDGYESVTFFIEYDDGGITFDATNKVEFVMEDSPDGSTWTAVETKDVVGAETATITDGIVLTFDEARTADVFVVGYVGGAQYCRVRADFSGTHGTGTDIGILAMLSNPHIAPAIS
jgi:hypothetical protein